MAADIGPKIGIDGEKEFRDALKSMGQQLKTLGTEMNAVTSAFDVDNDSQKKLASQSDILSRQLEVQQQRITEIQKALDYARQNYAENSNEVQRWQQALNNATADLNRTESGITAINEEMKNTSVVSRFGGALKSGLAVAAKAAAAATAAAAAAVIALTKSAVENYGEYEQLVGGVETLFKDSAGTVQEYANNAYKTAGLSANEYMETVTSFSASLLQSMGNDTQAAAEKADQAITDMSDNANKMGTDMQSIQNAYQGFAKQNYTMLDNLKLGYGGTKEEMQRLIDDANALNAAQGNYTNYTIESYADIVDAIHTVQTEMGITGTTALEASTTIEGSIGAMKAAYSNFVTGLGNDNADISELFSQLIQSVGTAAENVLPVVATVIGNISSLVQSKGPELLSQVLATVLNIFSQVTSYLQENLPQLIPMGLSALLSFSEGLRSGVGQLVDAALEMIQTLANGIIDALPEFIATVPEIISNFANTINDNAPKILKTAAGIINNLVVGLINSIPEIIANAPKIAAAIWDVITAFNWVNLGAKIVQGIGSGLKSMVDFAKSAAESVKEALHNGIKSLPGVFKDIGKNMIDGLVSGMKSMLSSALKSVGSIFTSIVDNVKGILGIHSPSRVFAGIGQNMALGLGQGFEKQMQSVTAGIQNAIPTPTVDTVYNAAAGMVNGLAAANAGNGGSYTINLVLQNGAQIASWLLPDIRTASKNNPEVATA